MKLNSRTVQVLNNFSKINPSLMFKKGDVIATISPTKTIFAKAKLDQEFEHDFAIFELNKFLNALALFKEPDVEMINSSQLSISSDNAKVLYTCADPETITQPPAKEIKIPNNDLSFSLPEEMFATVEKAAGVLGLGEICVVGDGSKFYLTAGNSVNPASDKYSVELGDIEENFNVVFKKEYLKIIPGNYQVTISKKGLSRFVGEFVEYFVPIESTSTFGE